MKRNPTPAFVGQFLKFTRAGRQCEPDDTITAVELARMDGDATGAFRGVETDPGPSIKTDIEIDEWICNKVATANHPSATCAMGIGPDSVLDPELRVRGAERLRVVDASAMPDLVSAHINACVLMMAERASDLIRGRPPLAPG